MSLVQFNLKCIRNIFLNLNLTTFSEVYAYTTKNHSFPLKMYSQKMYNQDNFTFILNETNYI